MTQAQSPLSSRTPSEAASAAFSAIMPGLFVLLWSTGFIGARYGLPDAEPMTFLAIRFTLASAILGALAGFGGAVWPRGMGILHVAIVGVLIQGFYLGGVFIAIAHGLPAALAALVTALQPLLTGAIAGWALREPVSGRQWVGLLLGLVGVSLVLVEKLWTVSVAPAELLGELAPAFLALFGITAGTVYQKRFGGGHDLRSANTIHYVICAAGFALGALYFETMEVRWTPGFIMALGWLVLVLSVGAITLFYLLIRRGDASRVASLMYLVPPLTALVAWAMFGDTLGPLALGGMVVVGVGVALVNR